MPRDKQKRLIWHYQAGYGWYTECNRFRCIHWKSKWWAVSSCFTGRELEWFRTLAEAKAHAETLAS